MREEKGSILLKPEGPITDSCMKRNVVLKKTTEVRQPKKQKTVHGAHSCSEMLELVLDCAG